MVNATQATDSFLAVMHEDGAVADGRVLATVPVGDGPREVTVSSDSRWAVVANYGGETPGSTLTVLDTDRHAVVRRIKLSHQVHTPTRLENRRYLRPHGIRFRADDRTVVVASEAGGVLLEVDTDSGKIDRVYPRAVQTPGLLAIDQTRSAVFVAEETRREPISRIQLDYLAADGFWNAGLRDPVRVRGGSLDVALRPDRSEAWVTQPDRDRIRVLDTRSLDLLRTIRCPGQPERLAFTPDGTKALLACAGAGSRAILDTATNHPTTLPLQEASRPGHIVVAPNGPIGFAADPGTQTIQRVDIQQAKILDPIQLENRPAGLGWIQAPAARPRDPVREWLATRIGGPVRPYYTTDHGRNRVAGGYSTVMDAKQAESLIRSPQAGAPDGFVAFVGHHPQVDLRTDFNRYEVAVAPGQSKWDILRRARTDGANAGHNNAELIAILRLFDALVPLQITHAGTDYIQADIDSTHPDFATVMRLAFDACSSGDFFQDAEEWAKSVKKNGNINIWWD